MNQSDSLIVFVTGANKGIGRETVRQLAIRGARVFLGARNREAGEKTASEIGGNVSFVEIDVTNPEMIERSAAHIFANTGHLDVLVNNAGVLGAGDDSVLTVDAELASRTFETNVLGPLRVTRSCVTLLAKSRAPRIINVSSGGGQLSSMNHWAPAYSVSKAALNALTRQFAAALPHCAVNSVCPGWVRTAMGGNAAPRSVEEGADTIVWLAAEAPQTLTGKFLRDRQVIDW